MATLMDMRRNILVRVVGDSETVAICEVILLAQCAEYVTGPDGKPVKAMVTETHRVEMDAKQLRALSEAFADMADELDAIDMTAKGSADADADGGKAGG